MREPMTVRTYTASPKLKNKAQQKAAARRESLSAVIRQILRTYTSDPEPPTPPAVADLSRAKQQYGYRISDSEYHAAMEHANSHGHKVPDVIRSGLLHYVRTGRAAPHPRRRTRTD